MIQPFQLFYIALLIPELCISLHNHFCSRIYWHFPNNHRKQREHKSFWTNQSTIHCKRLDRNRRFSAKSTLWDLWRSRIQLDNQPHPRNGCLLVGIPHTRICCSLHIQCQNTTTDWGKSIHFNFFFFSLRKKTVILCLCNWYKVLFREVNDTWILEHRHILQIKVHALHPPHSSSNQIVLLHMDSRHPCQSSTGIKKGVTSSAGIVPNWERITYFGSNAI